MPVTARLSRRFYDQFGDDIANELVDWFNKVDETYRSELRELNELNFARFDAKVEQRLAELGASLRTQMARLDAAHHRALAETKSDLMRWMFGLWATQMLALAGVTLALLSRLP